MRIMNRKRMTMMRNKSEVLTGIQAPQSRTVPNVQSYQISVQPSHNRIVIIECSPNRLSDTSPVEVRIHRLPIKVGDI